MTGPIVIIDDEPALRRLVAAGLGSKGFVTLEAPDGASGIETCLRQPPALVLCDLRMPGLDGFETLIQLRADPRTAAVPVILMTGGTDAAGMRRGMELGADDFLLKPFRIDDVVRAVQTRLARQQTLEARAERRQTARGDIGRTLSHELRTPLNVILGYASLLVEEGGTLSPAEIVDMAQGILRAGQRLDRLVERQLAYSELELLARDPHRFAAIAGDPIEDATAVVADVALRVATGCSREADLQVDGTPAPARIAQDHLVRIVKELVENALKFSKAGTAVRLVAGAVGERFRLSVSDAGPGMTAEQIASVGAYVQFDRRHLEQQGLGLGLALARKTAHLWGGTLQIASEPGRGTTVTVLI